MVYFQTQNPNLGKFWSVLQWKALVNFVAIWSILLSFGKFCSHLEYFVVIGYIWYVAPRKSGNRDPNSFWHAEGLSPVSGTSGLKMAICNLIYFNSIS
jgi:hypothetical protein